MKASIIHWCIGHIASHNKKKKQQRFHLLVGLIHILKYFSQEEKLLSSWSKIYVNSLCQPDSECKDKKLWAVTGLR